MVARALSFDGLSDAGLSRCVPTAERILFYDTTYEPSERMCRRVALADKVGLHRRAPAGVSAGGRLLQTVASSKLRRRLYGGRSRR